MEKQVQATRELIKKDGLDPAKFIDALRGTYTSEITEEIRLLDIRKRELQALMHRLG